MPYISSIRSLFTFQNDPFMDILRHRTPRARDCESVHPHGVIGFLDSASDGDMGFQPNLIDNKDRSLIIDALRRTTNGFIDEIRTLEMEGHSIHTCLNPCLSYKVLDSYGINDLEEAVLTMIVTSG